MDRSADRSNRKSLETLDVVALVLLFIGGINWALVGLFDFNLVSAIFGGVRWLENFIYVLVGISAIYMAAVTPKLWRERGSRTTTHTEPRTF